MLATLVVIMLAHGVGPQMKPKLFIVSLCVLAAGCAGATRAPVDVATRSGGAVSDTVNQTASGVGGAVRAPLRDFNLMQEGVPAVLVQAEHNPYDMAGLNDCPSLLVVIGQLDLALGPDMDTPRESIHRDAYGKGASMAAEAALDAVKDTAEGVIPMKSWVRKLSGAENFEKKARRAISAGTVRRGFLKGLGVMHNCGWPAAPLSFEPVPAAAASPPAAVPATSVLQTIPPATPAPAPPPASGPTTIAPTIAPTTTQAQKN